MMLGKQACVLEQHGALRWAWGQQKGHREHLPWGSGAPVVLSSCLLNLVSQADSSVCCSQREALVSGVAHPLSPSPVCVLPPGGAWPSL